jgi:hypothetical protein
MGSTMRISSGKTFGSVRMGMLLYLTFPIVPCLTCKTRRSTRSTIIRWWELLLIYLKRWDFEIRELLLIICDIYPLVVYGL